MAAVTLGYYSPNPRVERIYINGLGVPDKVWLERREGRTEVRFAGACGSWDEESVLATVRAAVPGGATDWDAFVAAAKQKAKLDVGGASPRGGVRASSRAAAAPAERPWEANQGSWTARDAALLSPDMRSHPLPAPTRLVVDHREPAEMVDLLRQVSNLEVEVGTLDVGDYCVPGKLVVERKTVQDFVTSITEEEKRLFHQSEAMVRSDMVAVLLVEGDLYAQRRMSLPQMAGAMSYLAAVQRVSVVPTLSLEHSAYLVAKLVRHAVHGLGYDLGLRGTAPRDPAAAAAFVLEGLPGLSATRAKALLAHFGSLAAVAAADEAALLDVPGIGAKTARLVAETFRARHAG